MDNTFHVNFKALTFNGFGEKWEKSMPIMVSFLRNWILSADQMEKENALICHSRIVICVLRYKEKGKTKTITTSSIQNPHDKENPLQGYKVALQRAVRQLFPKISMRTDGQEPIARQIANQNCTNFWAWFQKECVPELINYFLEEEDVIEEEESFPREDIQPTFEVSASESKPFPIEVSTSMSPSTKSGPTVSVK